MAVEFPTRPRLIDKLRLFHVFRPHFGESDAQRAVDALQDEFAPMATHDDANNLKVWIRAEINAAIVKLTVAMGVVGGLLLAIAELT